MIVPVKKIRILTAIEEKDDLLKALQLESKFMLFDYNEEQTLPSDLNNKLKAIERGVEVLSAHEKKKFFAYHEVSRTDFELVEERAKTILARVNEVLTTIEASEAENINLHEEINKLSPYLNISVETSELAKLAKTRIVFGYVPLFNFEVFNEETDAKGHVFEESSRDEENVYGAFGYELVYENEATKLLQAYRFQEVTLSPYTTKLSSLLPELTQKVEKNKKVIEEGHETIKKLSSEINTVRAYYDYYYNKALRDLVSVKQTERVAYLEGWVREDEYQILSESLKNKIECDIEELTVNGEELVPTATKNNRFVKHFESITNMFSVPNPKELDPNPVMSIWYWVIFGIMIGDVGYGILMLIFFTLFLKLKKPKGSLKSLSMIFAFSSIPAIIFGVLTGGFFGYTFDLLKIIGTWFGNPNLSSIVLQPVDDPLPMLIFSLVLGVLHIISALILKVINEARKKDVKTLLADGVSWISILVGIIFAILGMIVIESMVLKIIGFTLVGTGVLLILFLAGRDKKGIVGKALSGLGGLYGATSYLSDILSYSRILALSLSSAVIAFTMNLLADMVIGVPVAGVIFAIAILLIGHIFNFAMGLLSAYVHDGRLQYLEFFGKFYEGGGYEFKPFSYELKYINEIKENE